MRIAVISNTDTCLPLIHSLLSQNLQIHLFFSPSTDSFVNQKVESFSQQFRIAFTQEKNKERDLYEWLLNGNFTFCFMLGYDSLIDLNRLKQIPYKIYNIHFGLLPQFRGPVPVFWQLKSGLEKIGLTIHEVSSKFDSGKIVWIKETDNLPHYNYELLNQLFSQLCVEGVFYILSSLINKIPLIEIDRKHYPSTYFKRPYLKDVTINWEVMTAKEICDLVRACNPWNKGAITYFNNTDIKIVDALSVSESDYTGNELPGTIINEKEYLEIVCSDRKLIRINMFFYNAFFLPAYNAKLLGLSKGKQLGIN